MLPIILALVFIAIILIVVATGQSNEFTVVRQIKIAAPPERVFPHVNELRNWEAWNPWGKLDPNCQMTYSGPPAGVGASYSWSGNSKIGAGRNTITESEPGKFVRFRLEFLKPMVATNSAEFTFRTDGDGTVVTWTMTGQRSFGGKLFGMVLNCDKMCGDQFEKGLAGIRSVVERAGSPVGAPA